jgi:hypothetical protein
MKRIRFWTQISEVRFLILAGLIVVFSGIMHDTSAQGVTNINVTGISPVIEEPFTDRFEQNFRNGRYQVIFTYNNNNSAPVDFRFRFRLTRGGEELINVVSEPRSFRPGAYVFTSVFEDLPFRQTFDQVLSQLDSEVRNQVVQEGTIPEGSYVLNIEAIPEDGSGTIASPPSVTPFTVRYPQPPTLINPPDQSNLTLETPVFNWTPVVGMQGLTVEYNFLLVEVLDFQTPLQALNSNRAHAQRTLTNQNSIVYTPDFLPLESGQQYAWQVTAGSQGQTLPIKNEGVSEVRTFVYKGESSPIAKEDLEKVPLQEDFAILTKLDRLEITEQANSIILNGPASMEVRFANRSEPYEIGVNVQDLHIQKGSLDRPVITRGSVVGTGNFFEEMLGESADKIDLSEVRWNTGKGLTAKAKLLTPDENTINTKDSFYLQKSGISGTVTAQGRPIASLGGPPIELMVTELKATMPGGQIRGTGEVRTLDDVACDIPYLSLKENFRFRVDCDINKSVNLVGESDRLTLNIDGAQGQVSGSWSNQDLTYDLGLDSKLALKLRNDQYCENPINISLSSEDGIKVDSFIPSCVDPDPTLDLGLLQLAFSDLGVESFGYDQQNSSWDFDLVFNAELFFPTAPNVKLPAIQDVHLTDSGIRFPETNFDKPDLQSLGDIDIDQLKLQIERFAMDRFTFPWFSWQQIDSGPWDFSFDATLQLPQNPNYPSCLNSAALDIRGAHIEDRGDGNRAVVGDIETENLGSCSWNFGSGHTLNINKLGGSMEVNYLDGELEGTSEVSVVGNLALGQPFNCGSGDQINLTQTNLTIAGGIDGSIENIIPQCPVNVGPYTAMVTSSNMHFNYSPNNGQKAMMDAQAELEISQQKSATGGMKIDLMSGKIDSAGFTIQGPFEWDIPKENPVLTFRVDEARVTDEGFFVDGRQELLIKDETIGATFDQLVLDWNTFEVKEGSITLDETFSLQVGIDSVTKQLDYKAALGDSTLTFSPGMLMNLAGTVTIDTLGLHTSGSAQTKLDFGDTVLDSLNINYSDDFAIGLKPFKIKKGKAELFWNQQRVAFADNSGFHPDIGFFGEQFLPERLPLPTEQIAYIQLKENDQLVVNTTSLPNGAVKIETKTNTPLKLVLPALKGNQPQVPEVSVSLSNVRVNPSTGNYMGGTITASVPQNDSRFDLDRLNIPLLLNKIEYAKRNVNGNMVERLFLDGNLKLFDKDLGSGGSVSLFVESDGDVKGSLDLPNLNAEVPLDPNSDRVVAKLDSLGGVVNRIPLLNNGNPQFTFNIKGGFQINNQSGDESIRADVDMRFDDQGFAVTNFNTSALQDSASLDLGTFGVDIGNINSLNLGYSEQNGFNYFAELDFALRLNLPNQNSMAFPLKNVEIRNDIGFVIPQQDIHDGSTPSLNAPALNLGKFSLEPLAFRMQRDTVNWHTFTPGDLIDIAPKVDLELTFPGFQSTAPELAQLSVTLQDLGFSDGVFTGTMLPIDRTNDPIFLPIGSEAGIHIDGISGGLLDPGNDTQGFDVQLSGYFDMPSYFMEEGQSCNQTRVDINLSREGGLSGTVDDFLPCGELEMGPLALAFSQSTLDFSFSNQTQQATLAGGATADIERENASPITANGNLTFDLLKGKVLNGSVGINQTFDWYFPSKDSLFAFEVQSARIDTAGLVFTGGGSMKAGDGSVGVTFNDLAFSLADGSLAYGSVDMQASFALDIGINPTTWAINSSSDSMRVNPGVRLTMPSNLTLDKNGMQVDGSSGASLKYGDETYANLNLDFVNMMIGFDPVGVTSGRADFIMDQQGQDHTRLGWYDSQGFHPDNIAGGVPLPDTLGLPTKDVAYIVLKDQNGNNRVQTSAVDGGMSISTSQPIPLILSSMTDSNGDHPQVDVSFSDIEINGSYEVVGGAITADLSGTPLNLSNYGDYPFGLMALHFEKQQNSPYKLYADATVDLPDALTEVGMLLEKIALGQEGFENTTISFGNYTTAHTEGSVPAIASHSFGNDDLYLAMRGAELEFSSSNSYRLSGDISSSFLKNANGDSAVVHFSADYSNSKWQFALDTNHLTPQEFPIGQGKLILDDIEADATQQEFALVMDGRFNLAGVAGDDLEISLEDLRVGTQGVSVGNVNTSGLTPQSLSMFGQTDNMTISNLDVGLTSQNHLMLTMDGELNFLDRNFSFSDFKLGSDGTFEMGSGGVNLIDPQSPVQLMDQYFVLTELSIGIQNNKAALTAGGDVTLPAPLSSTSTTTLTVDHTGNVSSSGPQFQINDASVDLGDIATLKLTGAGFEINDISTPDMTLFGSAEVIVDGKKIQLGSPGSPSSWGIRYKLGDQAPNKLEWNSPSNHPSFTFNAGFFDLTIKKVEMMDGQNFGLSINTTAEMSLDGIGGSLDLDDFEITSTGIESMGKVTGGGLNIAQVVDIKLGSFKWGTNESIEVEVQDGSNQDPGSKTKSIPVKEYLSFTDESAGGNSTGSISGTNTSCSSVNSAVSISIPGGFCGSIDEILYYKTSNSFYLNIDGVDISLSDYARLYASFEYLKQPNGFKLKVAGGGDIKAGGQEYGIAAMGRMSTLNNQFSFGIFVSVSAEVPIVPGAISLTKAGGGFFYKASNQDFEEVKALSNYEFYNDKEPWVDKSGDYDFAIALNAEVGMVGMGGAYAISGKTMILITDQWFALDVQGTILNQEGKLTGGMYLNVGWSPRFNMQGGVGVKVDYPAILTGNMDVDFFAKKTTEGEPPIWAIDGDGNLKIIGGITADTEFIVSPDGFYVELNVSQGFDVWLISIKSNFNGSLWWIYNEQFGAYVEIGFDAKLFGGAASIGGNLKGALIVDDGYLVYASASAHVSVFMVFNGRVSVWVSVRNGKFNGGKGSNGAYESMIEDAKEQAENMKDKMNDAADAAGDIETEPEILKISDAELAAAGSRMLDESEYYKTALYSDMMSNERYISTNSPPSIYSDIRSEITNNNSKPQESSYSLSSLRSNMESSIDNLTQMASNVRTRLQQTRTAAIQWEAQSENIAQNVINNPVSSSQMDWQGDQPPSFDIDQNKAASNQSSMEQYKQDIDALDQKYKAALDSIRTNIGRIDDAMAFKLATFSVNQQGLDGSYSLTQESEGQISANMVSERYTETTKDIDKFYAHYISYLWSTHYWAKENLNDFENLRSDVRDDVIQASETQLQDVGVDVNFVNENNVNVNSRNGTTFEMNTKVKRTARDRYYYVLLANPDYSSNAANTEKNNFASEMDNLWSNNDYQSFYANFVQKGIELWYKMPRLGYTAIRDTARTQAEGLATKYDTNVEKMENAHENFSRLVDDIYEIKASMNTTLHGLLDVYIGWKSDTSVVATDSTINALKQEKKDLEDQLAAPQISNIYVTKNLSDFHNKAKLSWQVQHPTGSISENSYNLARGSNTSVFGQNMLSTGSDTEVTRYLFKEAEGQGSKNYNVTVRARGPGGIAISKGAAFTVDVDEEDYSYADISSYGGTSRISETDDTPPTEPIVGIDLNTTTSTVPVKMQFMGNSFTTYQQEESYWTQKNDEVTFQAMSFDPQSDIAGFEYAIGSSKGGTDVRDWTTGQGERVTSNSSMFANQAGTDNFIQKITIRNLNMQVDQRYYLSVRSVNGDSLISDYEKLSKPIRYDDENPSTPTASGQGITMPEIHRTGGYIKSSVDSAPDMMSIPSMSEDDPEITVQWNASSDQGSGVRKYEYVVSKKADAQTAFSEEDVITSWDTEETITGDPLNFEDEFYVHIRAVDYAKRPSNSVLTYGPVNPRDPTAPDVPVMAASVKNNDPGFYLLRPSLDLETDIDKYELAMGTSRFSENIRDWAEQDMSSVDLLIGFWKFYQSQGMDWPDQEAQFVDVPTDNLSDGQEFHLQLRTINRYGSESPKAYSGPIMIDNSPPQNPSISLTNRSYNSTVSISVSGISDPHSGIKKVEYKVMDPSKFINSQKVVQGWTDLMSVSGTPTGTLSGGESVDISGHSFMDLRIYVRVTNGNGLQTTVTKQPAINDMSNQSGAGFNNYNYNTNF